MYFCLKNPQFFLLKVSIKKNKKKNKDKILIAAFPIIKLIGIKIHNIREIFILDVIFLIKDIELDYF